MQPKKKEKYTYGQDDKLLKFFGENKGTFVTLLRKNLFTLSITYNVKFRNTLQPNKIDAWVKGKYEKQKKTSDV